MNKVTYIIFISLLLSSCINKNPLCSSKQKEIINNLVKKFPSLNSENSERCDYFHMVRTVKNGKWGFEISLLSEPDNLNDPQQLLIFTNAAGEMDAIPLFSNTYRDYWDFEYDSLINDIPKTNTSFDNELHRVFENLEFNKQFELEAAVIDEMLTSLLNTINLNEGDSAEMLMLSLIENSQIPLEETELGHTRLKKNYDAIISEWHPEEFINNYNAYLDKCNGRIYQFINDIDYPNKRFKFKVKNYRQDCNFVFARCGNKP